MAFWNAPLDDKEHRDQRLQSRDRHAGADRGGQQGARGGGAGRRPSLHSAQGRRRPQHRRLRGRQHGVRPASSTIRCSATASTWPRAWKARSKEYGFPIIVGSKTAMAVKDKFAILELDFIMVKGKTEPEVIYAIAGREDVAQSERFPAPAQPDHRDAGLLPLARLGRRAGCDRARPQQRRRRMRWSISTNSMRRASRLQGEPAAGRLERRLSAADEVAPCASAAHLTRRQQPSASRLRCVGVYAALPSHAARRGA